MKLINNNKNEKKLQIERLEDLWYLSQIIEPDDLVRSKSERKLKIGDDKIIKKTVILTLEVTKTELCSDNFRVSGTVFEGTDDVPKGVHHTFTFDKGSFFVLTKQEWLTYHLNYLKESQAPPKAKIVICVMDREEAHFAVLSAQGINRVSDLSGNVAKKNEEGQASGDFYADIIKVIEEYLIRYDAMHAILASPAFFKDDVFKKMSPELKKKIILATSSTGHPRAFDEVLKRDEVQLAILNERAASDLNLVENILERISKDGAVSYGLDAVENAINAGAVEDLIIVNSYLELAKETGEFSRLNDLMKLASKMKAKVHLVSFESEGGKQLLGIGGIAALLRYKM